MKAILMSIRPEWCDLIIRGQKTIEVRKTRPKLETPFRAYIYCTRTASKEFNSDDRNWDVSAKVHGGWPGKMGRVIGEFTCNDIDRITPLTSSIPGNLEERILGSCLTPQQVEAYAGWKGRRRTAGILQTSNSTKSQQSVKFSGQYSPVRIAKTVAPAADGTQKS